MLRKSVHERLTTGGLVLLLAYPAWVRGGTQSGYQAPMEWLAFLLLGLLLVPPLLALRKHTTTTPVPDSLDRSSPTATKAPSQPSCRRAPDRFISLPQFYLSLLKDPVLYAAILFLTLLAVQRFNAGRELFFDYNSLKWIYGPPPIPGLPSAVTRPEAHEMWVWFFPAFTAILAVRHGIHSRRGVRFLLRTMVLNAAALAGFGIVQFASRTEAIYWTYPLSGHFFASFGYSNHAASFFVLMFSLSVGLITDLLLHGRSGSRRRKAPLVTVLIGCTALSLVAVHMSLCRAGICLLWGIAALTLFWSVTTAMRRLPPAGRVNVSIAAVAVVLLFCMLSASAKGPRLTKELDSLTKAHTWSKLINVRWWQTASCIRILKEHPWFGVGGWGYRYFASLYASPEQQDRLRIEGKANVHNDTAQFLVEFGTVGCLLLAATLAILARPLFTRASLNSPLLLFSSLGLAAVAAHSLVDLPFRSPAVLFSWVTVLSSIARSQALRSKTGAPSGPRHGRAPSTKSKSAVLSCAGQHNLLLL